MLATGTIILAIGMGVCSFVQVFSFSNYPDSLVAHCRSCTYNRPNCDVCSFELFFIIRHCADLFHRIGEGSGEYIWKRSSVPNVPRVSEVANQMFNKTSHPSQNKTTNTANTDMFHVPSQPALNSDDEADKIRVLWLQKEHTVSDQSFDSHVIMARGTRDLLLTSRRIDDEPTHETISNLRRHPTELNYENNNQNYHTDKLKHLRYLSLLGTATGLAGFVLQFEAFRGMSWACSIAQLVAILIMTVLRAWIRLGMLDRPNAAKVLPDREMDWLALHIGLIPDFQFLLQFSENRKIECCPRCDEIHKTNSDKRKYPKDAPSLCELKRFQWRISHTSGYATTRGLLVSQSEVERSPSAHETEDSSNMKQGVNRKEVRNSEDIGKNPETRMAKRDNINKVNEFNETNEAQTVLLIRRRLGFLTGWDAVSSPVALQAIAVSKAICVVLRTFWPYSEKSSFTWYLDVEFGSVARKSPNDLREATSHSTTDALPRSSRPSQTKSQKISLVVNNVDHTWDSSTLAADITAVLSLWKYNFALEEENTRQIQEENQRVAALNRSTELTKPVAADTIIRRILGPWVDSSVNSSPPPGRTAKTKPRLDALSLDLAWWIGGDILPSLEKYVPGSVPDNVCDLALGFCGSGMHYHRLIISWDLLMPRLYT